MIFLNPAMLALVVFCFLPWFGPWKGKNPVQNIMRSLAFLSLSVALAMPHIRSGQDVVCKVLILDRSESVSEAARIEALSHLDDYKNDSDTHLVTFGEPLPTSVGTGFSSVTVISEFPSRGTSPLSEAITRAQGLIPRGTAGSVTIASDALGTKPDDDRAIAALREQNIPVHWVEMEMSPRSVTPVGVRWEQPLRKGADSRIRVRLASSSETASGTLVLKIGERELARTSFAGGSEQSVSLAFEPDESGFLDATVVAENAAGIVKELSVVLPVLDPYQLLYVGERQKGASEKLASMLGPSFDILTVDLSDTEELRAGLDRADLVLLDDQPADQVPAACENAIVDAVQNEGLGLVMSGGRSSFGGGGWHDRPIETLLPVELVQKEEKRDPSTSLVIVIDTSGSMSGVRVQLAKEVSRLAMKRLLPHDKVGIVEFYGAKRWAAPLQPASNAIELQRALNRMDAGGGTVILPALEEAFYGLQNVDTRYKHVLVLTDGGVESGDFESLMRRMANEGINVSTVLAGGGYHSEFLVNIANWGKGRFYNVPNRFNLPEILLKQPSTTKLPSYRPGVHVVQARGGSGWWGDVDTRQMPSLAGYVEAKLRDGGEVLLETEAEKHPVLATWRYGLGRVTTLTTEPLGEGTSPWKEWPEYGNALARILQRSSGDLRDPFRYEAEVDGGDLLIHAIRQAPRKAEGDPCVPVARIVDGNSDVVFRRSSPDRYVAKMPIPRLGENIRLETSASSTPQRRGLMAVMSPVVAEHFVDPQNSIEPQSLVKITGGKWMSPESDWSQAPTSEIDGSTLSPLAPLFYFVSLMLFLTELVYRRLPRKMSKQSTQTKGSIGIATAAVFLCMCFTNATVLAEDQLDAGVIAAAEQLVESGMSSPVTDQGLSQLFNTAIIKEGNLETTLKWLAESTGSLDSPVNRVKAEIEVKLRARRGDLQQASERLTELLLQEDVKDQRLDLILDQAKLHDALGETEQAKKLYVSLTKSSLPVEDKKTVSLRLALMGLLGESATRQNADAKALIELATESGDVDFRNRAANVLAVQNLHSEALKLFTVQGTGTILFRSASRVTEWAIRAKERDSAIKTAWTAVDAAQLKRDRNYALALLVEAYRLKEQKAGIETLVGEFKKRNDAAEKMTSEMQRVWIDLLRELGRYEDAISLFRESSGGSTNFTVEMRRELLELEGEAGNREQMIATYRELIESEPDELTWRGGLTQILLENGDNSGAEALWKDYIGETQRGSILMSAAQTLGELGLDLLAKDTVERMVELRLNHGQALLYWADLQQRRGDVEGAESSLNRVQAFDDVGDEVRAELASAYERIGRQDKAIEVNEAIRATREVVAEDLEMRLAWLYSEVGDEEKALEQWLALWRKITSIPRRRYVEDRLMTVASRLGTLADITIEIEEKLADGTADAREAGLLVRIYSRVNDSVAATEISEEYMSQTGKDVVEQLQEKGRIYQICNDYWNYEKVIEQLIEVDPEGETEYLRQLALSMLERGKAQDARKVLMNLRDADDGKDSIGGEFEAGVLSLVGMKEEAADAYRQAIATHPDRIESYLLLASLLKENNQTERAVGMFQYLAENAERDDLFTIAIDGLLNMEAKGRNMQWARRITLERLAGREDKNYLYQLLSDLSAEVNDKSGQIRALENSLAVSGSRRLSVLRECMELSSNIRGGVYYSSSSRGPTNKGNLPFFAFGRRLIGLNELMPPQVFLDLGKAFLDNGDAESAERTFGMARNLADPRSYQREVAEIFERAGKIPEALERYDRLLRTSPSDVALMARVAKLNEIEGKDAIAFRFYQRGLNLLLSQTPLTTRESANSSQASYWNNNRDAYQTYSDQLLMGMLVTVPDKSVDSMLLEQRDRLRADLEQLAELQNTQNIATGLSEAPRIEKRFVQLQRLFLAMSRIELLEEMDALVLNGFPEDQALFNKIAQVRLSAGRRDSLARLAEQTSTTEKQKDLVMRLLGNDTAEEGSSVLTPEEMWKSLLPAWLDGDRERLLAQLRRLNRKSLRSRSARVSYVIVNGRAVPQTQSKLGDVQSWMRLAVSLEDDDLALQMARAKCSNLTFQNQQAFYQMCREILPKERFSELVRYAVNEQSQQPARLANYLWLLSEMKEQVSDLQPSDGELLGLIQNGNLRLGYSFPFPIAMKCFPESIRADALAESLDGVTPKTLPQELIRVPFFYDQPIDQATQKVILAAFSEGIDAALQDNYLRYCSYYMPRTGKALEFAGNRDLAIGMLDLLIADKVRKRESNIAKMAALVKAMVLFETGETDADKEQAVQQVLALGSPLETVSDTYLRMTRTWVFGKFLQGDNGQCFLDALPTGGKNGELTIDDYSKRITMLQRLRVPEVLQSVYAQAAKSFPDESRFRVPAPRRSSTVKSDLQNIVLQEKQLKDLNAERKRANSDDGRLAVQRKQNPVLSRLAAAWVKVDHPVNALKTWAIYDENQQSLKKNAVGNKEAAETEKKMGQPEAGKPAESPVNSLSVSGSSGSKTAPARNASRLVNPKQTRGAIPLNPPRKPGQPAKGMAVKLTPTGKPTNSKSSVSKPEVKKKYAKGVSGVKEALEAEDKEGVLRGVRGVWRVLPPAVSSPYGSRVVTKPLNLTWPTSATARNPATVKPQQSAIEKKTTALSERSRKRGGLSTFVPLEAAPPKPRTSMWEVLAEYPYVLPEMERVVRSSFTAPQNAKPVSLGLLRADRLSRGDEQVLAELIGNIRDGQLTSRVLDGFFEIVGEEPGRINDTNKQVLESLMDQLGVKNAEQARLLAPLYAETGDRKKAAALYVVAAFFPTRSGDAFSKLVSSAEDYFEGKDLLDLVEAMFVTAYDRKSALPRVLELRRDLLAVADAAAATQRDFTMPRQIHDPFDVRTLIAAAAIHAANAEHAAAVDCMHALLKQHGKPLPPKVTSPAQYYYRPGTGRAWKLTRRNLLDLFDVSSRATIEQRKAWLNAAAVAVAEYRGDSDFDQNVVCEALLTIAYHQSAAELIEDVKTTCLMLDDAMLSSAGELRALAVDLMRVGGLPEQVFKVEEMMLQDKTLTHVRFGDFVRDAAAVQGAASGRERFTQLCQLSLDQDLLAAGKELSEGDAGFAKTVVELEKAKAAAEEALRKRASKSTVVNRTDAAASSKASNVGTRVPALPLKRVLKKP